jgi:NAD(P)-dependent dehydrogenase (short-subunit alcohol dehydrogenase family)
MTGRLEGKVALVTGASSGIGRASALAFAREGAKVVAADIVVAGGEETVALIKQTGGEAIFVKTDVSKAAEAEALVNRAIETFGQLDCAHNNAGIEGNPADESEAEWDRVLNVNLKGVWLCMKAELPQMLKQGKGAIVNTSSIAGLVGFQGLGAYGPSKAGVAQLTRNVALAYAKSGIRINAVCPGIIDTPMVQRSMQAMPEMMGYLTGATPLGRLGKPEEIAEAVVWLCSDAASFVTGLVMPVDGGWTTQ